jgi:hypothetical protein
MKTFKTESIREEITLFIRNWVELLSNNEFEKACQQLDATESDYDPWNVTNLKEAFLDYGAVGRMPVINSPYQMDLTTEKIEFYDYDDGSGWTVDYDIPLDGEWGDLTAQFSFKKAGDSFVVKLNDIHVM